MPEDFSWRDGERLIRFADGALAETSEMLASRGFENYALLTTERAADTAPELAERAAVVAHVPSGPVPKAEAIHTGPIPIVRTPRPMPPLQVPEHGRPDADPDPSTAK